VRRHEPELRELAGDQARIRAYVDAYRALPRRSDETALGEWLEGFVRRASTERRAEKPSEDFWARLAAALAEESPALAPPALPEQRFPVVPRLQRRRRLKGPR
jgi:hypothetical protein